MNSPTFCWFFERLQSLGVPRCRWQARFIYYRGRSVRRMSPYNQRGRVCDQLDKPAVEPRVHPGDLASQLVPMNGSRPQTGSTGRSRTG